MFHIGTLKKVGSTCRHHFLYTQKDKTQFGFPTLGTWEKLNQIFPHWVKYEDLRFDFEEMKIGYRDLKRVFKLEKFQSDVLRFNQEAHITKTFDHPTQKPETLSRFLIKTCSQENDLIVVPFAGSGTECAMAAKEKRNYIGYDINQKYVDMANNRCNEVLNSPTLF